MHAIEDDQTTRRVRSRHRSGDRWSPVLKVAAATAGVAGLVFMSISTLAAYVLSNPQRYPLSPEKTPGALPVVYADVRFPARRQG
jgi:hypothetical protein